MKKTQKHAERALQFVRAAALAELGPERVDSYEAETWRQVAPASTPEQAEREALFVQSLIALQSGDTDRCRDAIRSLDAAGELDHCRVAVVELATHQQLRRAKREGLH